MNWRALFLDRDGTLIEDTHYPKDPTQTLLLPKVAEGLKLLKAKGYLTFVISNQSGVGRGLIRDDEFKAVHLRFCELLEKAGTQVDGFFYCFHHPEDPCQCRKPKTGLIPHVFQDRPISMNDSFTVGDKLCDLQLADHLGARGCLVLTGKGKDTFQELKKSSQEEKYLIFDNLLDLAHAI